MATKLKTKVRRELTYTCVTKQGRICAPGEVGARPVSITLNTNETISFKIKGTQREYVIHAIVALQIAQNVYALEKYNEKLQEYQMKRKAGYRVRRPNKPYIPTTIKLK